MYDNTISTLAHRAFTFLDNKIKAGGKKLSGHILSWIGEWGRGTDVENIFKNKKSFPLLLLSYWAIKKYSPVIDEAFLVDMLLSSVCMYLYIRFIDNSMDGDVETDLKKLPILNFFHTEFEHALMKYFPAGHTFWNYFHNQWYYSAEVTIEDACLTDITQDIFHMYPAVKFCSAAIQPAAICFYYNKETCITAWTECIELLSGWHQMINDIFDWHKDLDNRALTFFLCEAKRRKKEGESVEAWIYREGIEWGISYANNLMEKLKNKCRKIHSDDFYNYLCVRQNNIDEKYRVFIKGIKAASNLWAGIFDS